MARPPRQHRPWMGELGVEAEPGRAGRGCRRRWVQQRRQEALHRVHRELPHHGAGEGEPARLARRLLERPAVEPATSAGRSAATRSISFAASASSAVNERLEHRLLRQRHVAPAARGERAHVGGRVFLDLLAQDALDRLALPATGWRPRCWWPSHHREVRGHEQEEAGGGSWRPPAPPDHHGVRAPAPRWSSRGSRSAGRRRVDLDTTAAARSRSASSAFRPAGRARSDGGWSRSGRGRSRRPPGRIRAAGPAYSEQRPARATARQIAAPRWRRPKRAAHVHLDSQG